MNGRDYSLRVFRGDEPCFTSEKKWLHPLFDLEAYLTTEGIDGGELTLEDKIVGRGAAFLIVRLGIRKVHARILSSLGRSVFDRHGIAYTWDTLVDRIDCRTEDLLRDETDPEKVHAILEKRARS